MRKFFYFFAVPSLLFLSSCATPGWYKAGVSRMDTENTLAQCEYNVSINQVNDERFDKTVNNCMKAQGFRYVDNVPKDAGTYNPQPAYTPAPVSPAPQAAPVPAPAATPAPAAPTANPQDEWWK